MTIFGIDIGRPNNDDITFRLVPDNLVSIEVNPFEFEGQEIILIGNNVADDFTITSSFDIYVTDLDDQPKETPDQIMQMIIDELIKSDKISSSSLIDTADQSAGFVEIDLSSIYSALIGQRYSASSYHNDVHASKTILANNANEYWGSRGTTQTTDDGGQTTLSDGTIINVFYKWIYRTKHICK